MIRIISIALIFYFTFILNLFASTLSFEEVRNLGLNTICILTENNEEPSCDYVSAPEGCMGKSITNATKVPGILEVYSPKGELLYSSGEYEKGESGMTIKIRGNTSAYYTKKPYKIKLQKKADLLFRGDKDFNDKNWVLLNDNHLKLYTGFELSRLLEEDWTPSGMYVNVMINGKYRGMYYLVESIERNEKSRIRVSESGFIVEHDAYWWNENGAFILSRFNPLLNYTFKYPDYEDLSPNNLTEINNILDIYENELFGDIPVNLIDQESLAKWILGHDILGTWDGGGANLYLSKYDMSPESPIKAGPLWDFDTIEEQENLWSGIHTAFKRFNYLFEENNSFMEIYKDIWYNKGKEIYDGLMNLMDDYCDEEKWVSYNNSSLATSQISGSPRTALDAAIRDKEWFSTRFEWLKSQLGEYDDNHSGIYLNKEFKTDPNGCCYDVYTMQGVKILSKASKEEINKLKKGVYIIGNKKVFIK